MELHTLRIKIDELIFEVEDMSNYELSGHVSNKDIMQYNNEKRAYDVLRLKLQEAKMWAGKVLEAQNKQLPKEYRDYCSKREEGAEDQDKYLPPIQSDSEPEGVPADDKTTQDKPEHAPQDE